MVYMNALFQPTDTMSSPAFRDLDQPAAGWGPTTGVGSAHLEQLKRVTAVVIRAGRIPVGRGVRLDGHCTNIGLANGNNFSVDSALDVENRRRDEVRPLISAMPRKQLDEFRRAQCRYVPLDTDLFTNAVFEPAAVRMPANVRQYYEALLAPITDADLPLAISVFENAPMMCVCSALLKERRGDGRVVLGKLGFRDVPRGSAGAGAGASANAGGAAAVGVVGVYDWEYGEGGVRWI
jgi:hypothetical protein